MNKMTQSNMLNNAINFHQSGRLNEALTLYKKIIQLEPNNEEILSLTGFLYLQMGYNKQSIELLKKAISIKNKSNNVPQNWYAWLGIAYANSGLFDEAVAFYNYRNSDPYYKNQFFDELSRIFIHNGKLSLIYRMRIEKYKTFYDRPETKILRHLNINFISDNFSQNMGLMTYIHVYIKMKILGWYPCHNPMLIVHDRCPNHCYLNYLRPFFSYTIQDKSLKKAIEPLSSRVEVKEWIPFTDGRMINFATDFATEIQKQWNLDTRPPLLTLSEHDCERGQRILNKMGIPSNAWFVSLHIRDIHEGGNTTRNADFMTYKMAIQSIVKRGGWVIRMGRPSMQPLPRMDNVIDYAHSEYLSDWMDVYLWAKCKFFLGTNSGPAAIPVSFGVPSIMTNLAPLFSRPWFSDLFIPKLIWSYKFNRFLSFSEILSSHVGYAFLHADIQALDCKLIDNTPEDINDVVLEMFSRLSRNQSYSEKDNQVQEQFNNLQVNVEYDNQKIQGLARIGQAFSRKYPFLFK